MTGAVVAERWHEQNQRHLGAALRRVRLTLERHAARARGQATEHEEGPADASDPGESSMALGQLCSTFRLSPFERDVVVLCAGVELDAAFAGLCSAAHGDPQRAHPTFGLALAALERAHWSALAPGGPLRRWRLVEVCGPGLTASPLRIDERILHFLAGISQLDERLAAVVEPVRAPGDIAPSQRAIAERIAALWSQPTGRAALPAVHLFGSAVDDKRAIAATACRALGLQLHVAAAEVLPTAPADLETLIRLWEREAALSGAALLLDCTELDDGDAPRAASVARLIERNFGALFVASRERRRTGQRAAVAFEVRKPSTSEQRVTWRDALGELHERVNGQVDHLVSHFNLSTHAIHAAALEARGQVASIPGELADVLWDTCRSQARPRLEDLAQRIEPAATWDELILPAGQKQILHDLATHVRRRLTVYETWGFARQGERGLGISALFAGASGTGKTMAAEVLAGELRLDVYRIDLSSVVSKYIGETEKNLRRIFDAAEDAGAILLFDEADALFGKRSEVKDSHDRYANIEVSYLLQRMECYRGLAILTTNLKSALDPAFLRRIRFVIQFPFPDAEQRREIWRRVFPRETPVDGLHFDRLAQLNIAGGNIRSIALGAAFLAADAGSAVGMRHVERAARGEYAKLEKPLTEAELTGWEGV